MRSALTAAAAAIVLAGCQYSTSYSGSNSELNAEADAVYEHLLAGEDQAIIDGMSSENNQQLVAQQLPMLRDMVPFETAPDPIVLSSNQTNDNGARGYTVEQSYSHPDRIVVVRSEFVQEDDTWKLRGINLNVEMTGSGQGPGGEPSGEGVASSAQSGN